METNRSEKINAYIALFSSTVQYRLQALRKTIHEAVPGVEEDFQYNMPAFRYKGPLVYFGAFKKHIGFYATPSGHAEFKKELDGYKQGKGSVQFPLSEPLPLDLIRKIVIFRSEENSAK